MIILIFIVGCSLPTKTNFNDMGQLGEGSTEVSMGLGMIDDTSLTERQLTYKLQLHQDFTPEIRVVNNFPEEHSYRIYALLNSQKIQITYNGTKIDSIDLNLEARESKTLNITISDIQEGTNDLVLFIIRNETEFLTEEQYIPAEERYVVRRSKLIVGKEKPISDYYENTNYELISTSVDNDLIFVSREPSNNFTDSVMLVDKNELDKLWINVPIEDKKQQFSWFAIIDGEQVDTRGNFINPTSAGIISFPLDLKDLDLGAPSNLTIGIIENPLDNLEGPKGELNYEKKPLEVRFSNLITIK